MILVLTSDADPVGKKCYERLKESFGFKETENKYHGFPILKFKNFEVIKIKDEPIYANYILNDFKPSLVIFLSRHESRDKKPRLTVHFDGNPKKALLGGEDEKLSISAPLFAKQAILNFYEVSDIEVVLEATHHGPNLDVKSFWMEIGSDKEMWEKEKYIDILCETLIKLKEKQKEEEIFIGFGGGHYAYKFTEKVIKEEFAPGHIISKFNLDCSEKVIKQAFERNDPLPDLVYLDRESKDLKEKIEKILEKPVELI